MASDDVIQTIVSQVLARLGAETAPAAAAPQAFSGATSAPGRVVSAGGSGPCALVVLTAGDAQLDEVYRQLGALCDQVSRFKVYLSPSARKVLDLGALRRHCPRAEWLGELTHDLRSVVEGCDAVYLPTLTLSTASKIAYLNGDSVASLIPIIALMNGIPVRVALAGLYGLRADLPAPPVGFKAGVDEILDRLGRLGVECCDVNRLAGTAPAGVPVSSDTNCTGACAKGQDGSCDGCGKCAERNTTEVKQLVATGAARIGAVAGTKVSNQEVAGMIDHTLLKADANEAQVTKLCAEAREYVFASVCVNPGWVSLAAELLRGSPVKVCTVIGFPLGATTSTAKAIETRDAIANGATEIDMVINVGALKSGNDELVRRDISAVVDAARGGGIVKVIIETALLSDEEKVKACLLAKMAGADFVKTSTGFSSGGATAEDIALMRHTVGPDMGVKASGGVSSAEDARKMIAAGATRIGASASIAIAKGQVGSSAY